MFSRREVKEDIKEGFGEDIEMFFSFREEDREVVKDLSFSFRDLMFNLRDLSCKDFKVGGERRGEDLRNSGFLRAKKAMMKASFLSVLEGLE